MFMLPPSSHDICFTPASHNIICTNRSELILQVQSNPFSKSHNIMSHTRLRVQIELPSGDITAICKNKWVGVFVCGFVALKESKTWKK